MSELNHSFLTPDQSVLVNKVLEELGEDKRRLFDTLSPHEKEFLLQTFVDVVRGDPERYKTLWEIDYVRKPVTIHQFITDHDYFGEVGQGLFPCWERELDLLFNKENQITEVVVTGAIGTGKTTFATIALAYKLYTLTCLRNPFSYFELAKGTTSFVFGLFNATRELSTNVHMGKILGAFNSCPYFRWITTGATAESEKEKDVLKFPNNIKFVFGSRAMHALGNDLIGGMLDEMNFQQETKISEQEMKSQARDMYRQTSRRILSRFPPRPGLGRKSPGLLFLVSSRKGEDDFLDAHIRERGVQDDSMHVVSYATWDAVGHLPGRYPSGKWFRVVVGDDRFRSRVLEDNEPDPDGYRIVSVPEEHRKEFVQDPDGAIMDIAGVPIKGGGRPLIQRDRLYECIGYDQEYFPRQHPFRVEQVVLGMRQSNFIEDDFVWERIVQCVDPYKKLYMPIVNPMAHRYIHLDPATSGDCSYGFAMGHVAGRTKIKRFDSLTHVEVEITAPVIYIDIVLGIVHPPGDEIDLAKVRSFIFYLRKLGFPIYAVNADQYQSTDTLQTMKKHGFQAERVSLDLKPDNYSMFKQSIHEGRLLVYEYHPFIEEAIWLQVDRVKKDRVFALEKRHKDISDAVAGVVAAIMNDEQAEQSAITPIAPETQREYRPKGAIDTEGEWLLDSIPGIEHITGVRNG